MRRIYIESLVSLIVLFLAAWSAIALLSMN